MDHLSHVEIFFCKLLAHWSMEDVFVCVHYKDHSVPLSSPPSEDLQEVVSEERFGICFEALFLDEPLLLLVDSVVPHLCVTARRICCDDVCFVARFTFHLVPRPSS